MPLVPSPPLANGPLELPSLKGRCPACNEADTAVAFEPLVLGYVERCGWVDAAICTSCGVLRFVSGAEH